eukprot:GHVS01101131.1.p2 GENE.GHVS01101131.1~~GHVS01101131.1.p2  ORF type:complete len:146 (-),score=6.83 GHVS01101131.1:1052-1489(-)
MYLVFFPIKPTSARFALSIGGLRVGKILLLHRRSSAYHNYPLGRATTSFEFLLPLPLPGLSTHSSLSVDGSLITPTGALSHIVTSLASGIIFMIRPHYDLRRDCLNRTIDIDNGWGYSRVDNHHQGYHGTSTVCCPFDLHYVRSL